MATDFTGWTDTELRDSCECCYDIITQYRSECALFGDAGPGQGINARNAESHITQVEAELRRRHASTDAVTVDWLDIPF